MVTYLLDTSVIVESLRNNPAVEEFVGEHAEDVFLTSAICEAEIWEGIFREKVNFERKKAEFERFLMSLERVLVFDSEQAEIAGKIRAGLALKGELIGDIDVLIAAGALKNNAVIWTKNPKHFLRIKGLEVETLDGD